MNAPRLKRRSSASEDALKKFVRRQQMELGVAQKDNAVCEPEPHLEKKPEQKYQGACFLYTSAHCRDLLKLKEQADQLQTIEWKDLDIRQPRLQQQNEQEDGWEEVDYFNNSCDEHVKTNTMYEF